MPPPSRIRRILKWTGVGLSLAIVMVWIASCLVPVARTDSAFVATTIEDGVIYAVRTDLNPRLALIIAFITAQRFTRIGIVPPRLILHGWQDGHGYMSLILPLWLLLSLTATPTAWLFHRDRRSQRIRPGCCLRCGYNLTGNTSGVCSECGYHSENSLGMSESEPVGN